MQAVLRTRSLFACLLTTLAFVPGVARAQNEPARPEQPAAVSWATAQATEQTRAGRSHAAQGDGDAALQCFLNAVRFDATYGPAYLALGELYEARGDSAEAERAFSMGIDHVLGFFEALWGRARVRARLHRGGDAIEDLEAASSLRPDSAGVLRDLASAYIAARALPAALAVARRRLAMAQAAHDSSSVTEARLEVRALEVLVGTQIPCWRARTIAGRCGTRLDRLRASGDR